MHELQGETSRATVKLQKLSILQLSKTQYDDWNSKGSLKPLYNIFVLDASLHRAYYLIPELVYEREGNNTHYVHICGHCNEAVVKKKKLPKYSIGERIYCPLFILLTTISLSARGYDFGAPWKIGLQTLSLAEECLISKCRVYATIVKLRPPERLSKDTRSDALKGHCLTVAHNGAYKAGDIMPHLNATDSIQLVFIGEMDKWNRIRKNWKENGIIVSTIQVRPRVIQQWLQVLVIVNPLYADVPIHDFDNSDTITALQGIPELILENAHVTTDEQTLRIERSTVSSSAAGLGGARELDDNVDDGLHAPEDTDRSGLDAVYLGHLGDCTGSNEPTKRNVSDNSILTGVAATLRDAIRNSSNNPDSNVPTTSSLPITTGSVHKVEITRKDTAIDEFSNNKELFLGSFPWLFLFGDGIPGHGSMPTTFNSFILQHYKQDFAQCPKLIFLLFNQIQRHATARVASAKVNSSKKGINKFMDTINSPNFDDQLQAALKSPESQYAKKLMNQILPNITTAGAKIPFGAIERREHLYELHSLVQFYGLPTTFLTISPNEIQSPLTLRLCCAHENKTLLEIRLLTSEQRAKITSRNPVAAAVFFEKIIEVTLKELLGIKGFRNKKKMLSSMETGIGIIGKVFAFFGGKETQGRGTLHIHLLIWAALAPFLLQKCASDSDLINGIREVIESMVTAEISKAGYEALITRE
jgi:hypothetical protein